MQKTHSGKNLQVYGAFKVRSLCSGNVCCADLSYRVFLTRRAQPLEDRGLKGKGGKQWAFICQVDLSGFRAPSVGKDEFLELAKLTFTVRPTYAAMYPNSANRKAMKQPLWPHAMLPVIDHLIKMTGGTIEKILLPAGKGFAQHPISVLREKLEKEAHQKI